MPTLPFKIRRNALGSLTQQVVQGIQSAAQTGQFTPGARLPTLQEMSEELDVSMITMRRAIARLVADGVLEAHRGTGIRLRQSHEPRFQAQVLFLSPSPPASYYYAVRNHTCLKILREHNIHVTSIDISGTEYQLNYPTVRHILDTQPISLVMRDGEWLGREGSLRDLLVERGVRVVETWTAETHPEAVDSVQMDRVPAYRQLVRHCLRCKVDTFLWLSTGYEQAHPFISAARAAKLRVKHVQMAPSVGNSTVESFEVSGHGVIAKLLAEGQIERGNSMIISEDDYFTRGAITAFLEAGWQIPDDVQMVTTANFGHVPVMRIPITRIEMYPRRDGEAMAKVTLRNLSPRHRSRRPLVVLPQFMAGKSTRPTNKSRENGQES
jgi:DNA-binding LacI/PurR family transcriptional regulator/DNA-binding transcriptional regulator YhcF (GntR family)